MTQPENELGLISFEDGAKLLDIGIVTFKKLVDDGRIPFIQKTDKLRVVRKQDVLDYVNNQVKKPETPNNDIPVSDIAKVEEKNTA